MSRRVLVTGADGFVGRAVCRHFAERGLPVRGICRSTPAAPVADVDYRPVGDIAAYPDWSAALADISVVIHTAGRAHGRVAQGEDPLASCLRVNVEASIHLARAAVAAGVQRFIYLGSALAATVPDDAMASGFAERRPYPFSKRAAEIGLQQAVADTSMELVVLRPPLVYGPGVPANFRRLMQAVRIGMPLPFASVDNRRSFIYLGNLADAVAAAAAKETTISGTFGVTDGEPLSVPSLIRLLSSAMGRKPRLLPFPVGALRSIATVFGQKEKAESILDSLIVDDRPFRNAAGWSPPFTVTEGLAMTVGGD